jgi:hypothetical protein
MDNWTFDGVSFFIGYISGVVFSAFSLCLVSWLIGGKE